MWLEILSFRHVSIWNTSVIKPEVARNSNYFKDGISFILEGNVIHLPTVHNYYSHIREMAEMKNSPPWRRGGAEKWK